VNAEAVQSLRTDLEAAEKTLHSMPAAARVAAVGRVLDAWSDPGSPVRRRLLDEHPGASGLSRENVAAGLELALASWNHAALARLVEQEASGDAARLAGITTVVHGGVLPMPTLVDALAPIVLGSPVLAKPARRDPVTPRLVEASLAELAPELGDCLALADVRRSNRAALDSLLAAPRVVVTGGDEAIAGIEGRIGHGTRLIAHGHKLSVALLGTDVDVAFEDASARLAVDVSLWDQLGCLSPIACWVVGDARRADRFAAALGRALARREGMTPRGEVGAGAAAWISNERAEAEIRAAAGGGCTLYAGDAWTVVAESDATPRAAPLHRFVRVHPLAAPRDLPRTLGPLGSHVAGVAHAGLSEAAAQECRLAMGASRAAPFGRLQAPPLDWGRDGLGVLASLL